MIVSYAAFFKNLKPSVKVGMPIVALLIHDVCTTCYTLFICCIYTVCMYVVLITFCPIFYIVCMYILTDVCYMYMHTRMCVCMCLCMCTHTICVLHYILIYQCPAVSLNATGTSGEEGGVARVEVSRIGNSAIPITVNFESSPFLAFEPATRELVVTLNVN